MSANYRRVLSYWRITDYIHTRACVTGAGALWRTWGDLLRCDWTCSNLHTWHSTLMVFIMCPRAGLALCFWVTNEPLTWLTRTAGRVSLRMCRPDVALMTMAGGTALCPVGAPLPADPGGQAWLWGPLLVSEVHLMKATSTVGSGLQHE